MTEAVKVDHTSLEIANGFRLFDYAVELTQYYLNPERPFSLRVPRILEMQKEAVDGVLAEPGKIRTGAVGISHSLHTPPDAFLVQGLLVEFCDYINDNWHEKTAFYLSAYAMWKINWIHAFADGNGRTARAISYILLCLKLGYVLPGTPTIPQQIEEDKTHYLEALEKADFAFKDGTVDVTEMERMIRAMLARQLLGIIDAAGPVLD